MSQWIWPLLLCHHFIFFFYPVRFFVMLHMWSPELGPKMCFCEVSDVWSGHLWAEVDVSAESEEGSRGYWDIEFIITAQMDGQIRKNRIPQLHTRKYKSIETGQNITVNYTWQQFDMYKEHVYRREVGDCGRANLAAGGWQVVYSVRCTYTHRATNIERHLRSGLQGQTVTHLAAQRQPFGSFPFTFT